MPNLESFKVCGPGWGGELTTHHPSQHFLYTSCGVELQGEDELQEKHDNLQSWIHSTMKAFVFKESSQRVVLEEKILRMIRKKHHKITWPGRFVFDQVIQKMANE